MDVDNYRKFNITSFVLFYMSIVISGIIFFGFMLKNYPNGTLVLVLKIAILIYFIYQIKKYRIEFNNVSLKKSMSGIKWAKYVSLSIILKINFTFIAAISFTLFVILFPSLFDYFINFLSEQNIEPVSRSALSLIIPIISTAILTPIWEELFFRGIVLRKLTKRFKPITAILISSLIFAIVHSGFIGIAHAFLMGCMLAYFYLLKQNIWIPIILHAVINLVAILLSTFDSPNLTDLAMPSREQLIGELALYGPITFAITFFLLLIFIRGWKQVKLLVIE
ncbi:CPBP family intramembrane glutamic endopeptidase [Paenisporosarcina sp. FSL H8-0542]|uniref:CPBP family intramembrane glutamic endopeptidase n=1 Tax=unclassified Paenisporosarcina TaxID=2642018 RepID=UPI00034E2AB6|nr:CPBP family intramembrane glutamic endopeptidase [Paenisporosarcina sp. HGH0030]EPD52292.1 hypothetical protein HMPREF1210_01645 [Paenisporosarcina sp. HGH0030]